MNLNVISYKDIQSVSSSVTQLIEDSLLHKGIIGIRDVPNFKNLSQHYIEVARQFSALPETLKQQYTPNRDAYENQGYELGAEWFKNSDGIWQIDEKKASYYAFVPNHQLNKWPNEIDLRTPYLALGELIFNTGKLLMDAMGLNQSIGLAHESLIGQGRMLHYHQENNTSANNRWCGAHFDNGIFTGLLPGYYFHQGQEIEEPEEAGLYIIPSDGNDFVKIEALDKSILLFQVGEFGQLLSNDRIKATKHMVKKAPCGIERFTFALFYSAPGEMTIQSKSKLNQDTRYLKNQFSDGSISYRNWEKASLETYRAK